MKKTRSLFILFFLTLSLLGCTRNQRPAPVIFKGTGSKEAPVSSPPLENIEEEVDISAAVFADHAVKHHIVAPGETLLTISNLYQVEIPVIIQENNLKPPYQLQPGDRVIIPKSTQQNLGGGSVEVAELTSPTTGVSAGLERRGEFGNEAGGRDFGRQRHQEGILGTIPEGTQLPQASASLEQDEDVHLPPLVRDLKKRHPSGSPKSSAAAMSVLRSPTKSKGSKPHQTTQDLLSDDADLENAVDGPSPRSSIVSKGSIARTKEAGVKVERVLPGKKEALTSSGKALVPSSRPKIIEEFGEQGERLPETSGPLEEDAERVTDTAVRKNEELAKPISPLMENTPHFSFIMPVEGKVIMEFGKQEGDIWNDGINIAAQKGDPVLALADGVVTYCGSQLRRYGYIVIIRHAEDWVSVYAHLDKINVRRGESVRQGQPIATVGTTGNIPSPQLHLELRKGNTSVDPLKYIGQ